MADAWIEDVFESDDGDLSSWEMINASEDDDENEDYSYDEDEDLYVLESLSSDLSTQTSPPVLIDHTNDSDHDDHLRKDLLKQVSIDERDGYNDYDEEEEDEKEEDGYDDDGGEYDLDDELVPKSVRDRFGRQRLRKLGKRAYPKMNKCKRLPYHYNRPGCVHGKHGLGLNHNIII